MRTMVTRRGMLGVLFAGTMTGVSGCLGDNDAPESVTIGDADQCDNCDMTIRSHRGPVGQAFYPNDRPLEIPDDREAGVARFCSSWCLYDFTLEISDLRGTDPVVAYATDYSTVSFGFEVRNDVTTISPHFDPESFADVRNLTFVVDSDVFGAMGSSLIGFSISEEAEQFRDERGGDLFTHDEISRELIQAL